MDYQSIHGQDVTNFSSPSQHRMPTKSAAQALQDLKNSTTSNLSTSVQDLDLGIHDKGPAYSADLSGGLKRGTVTEIYGPPGVGKTTLGLQTAANVLCGGENVVWLDCLNSISGPRLKDILESKILKQEESEKQPIEPTEGIGDDPLDVKATCGVEDLANGLSHFMTPSLPMLIALLCHPSPSFPPNGTALIVIDSLSSLVTAAYPRTQENPMTPQKHGLTSKNDPLRIAAARKWPVLQYLLTNLKKLAMLRDIAIVVLNQTVTKMQPGDGAILAPAIASDAWESGLTTRIVLFRDWGWDNQEICFAGVVRSRGSTINGRDGFGRIVAMSITSGGFRGVKLPDIMPFSARMITQALTKKRKAHEILDSEDEGDEDYGWEDGEELPPPPPQWQGSEDILVRGPGTALEEEDGEEEDPDALEEEGVSLSDDAE